MDKTKLLAVHKTYREPTAEEKIALYKFYELVFDSKFSLSKKRSVITAVLGYETWSWRVVGITEEAIKAIAKNSFNKPSRVLARDHTRTRAETYKRVFEEKMPFNEWWNWIWENDKTTLMTNVEHATKESIEISKVYEIDPNLSYFVDAEVAGWHQTKGREGAYINELCKKHNIDY